MDGVASQPQGVASPSALEDSGRPLGPSAARRLIAARLAALGRPADCITPAAREIILAEANGGERRLQSLLATALYLAGTENAPQVDLAVVQRARSLQRWATVEPVPTRALAGIGVGARRRLGWLLAAAGMAAVAALALMARHPAAPNGPTSGPVVASSPPMLSAPAEITPAPAPRVISSIRLATKAEEATPLSSTPGLSVAPPEPQTAGLPASGWQPKPPAADLLLRFHMTSPAAAVGAHMIEQRLGAAGFAVRAVPEFSRDAPRVASLRYFYAEDEAAARAVAQAALLLTTQPVLTTRPLGAAPPTPGTIELYLP